MVLEGLDSKKQSTRGVGWLDMDGVGSSVSLFIPLSLSVLGRLPWRAAAPSHDGLRWCMIRAQTCGLCARGGVCRRCGGPLGVDCGQGGLLLLTGSSGPGACVSEAPSWSSSGDGTSRQRIYDV